MLQRCCPTRCTGGQHQRAFLPPSSLMTGRVAILRTLKTSLLPWLLGQIGAIRRSLLTSTRLTGSLSCSDAFTLRAAQ